jgi:uncharacterized DUF497 family protein
MKFQWDENKNRSNLIKHRVRFERAILIFEDPHLFTRVERFEDGEERWQTIGVATGFVLLVVAHTRFELDGEEAVRIISARKATPRERRIYEDGVGYS